MPLFNFRTKLYEGNQRMYETYSEPRMTKWKCEKCYDLSELQIAIPTQD
jgi:hypothetical protein